VLSDWNAQKDDVNRALTDIDFWTVMENKKILTKHPELAKKLKESSFEDYDSMIEELIKANAF
jgi:hypothetical protein